MLIENLRAAPCCIAPDGHPCEAVMAEVDQSQVAEFDAGSRVSWRAFVGPLSVVMNLQAVSDRHPLEADGDFSDCLSAPVFDRQRYRLRAVIHDPQYRCCTMTESSRRNLLYPAISRSSGRGRGLIVPKKFGAIGSRLASRRIGVAVPRVHPLLQRQQEQPPKLGLR